ncbi:MAG: LysM peptidoglycan-binding domain-containing protein [Sedimentisphaerales bacterium]|nr:LysM peptidoglycan-binding domain-containing protein [Sedimentisphaerales bacterium]
MQSTAEHFSKYFLTQSCHIVILFVIVAVICYFLRGRSAHIRYLLWLLILAKCLIPPMFTISLAILPEPPKPSTPSTMVLDYTGTYIPAPLLSESSISPILSDPLPTPSPTWKQKLNQIPATTWFALIWALGMLCFTIYFLGKAIWMHYKLVRLRCVSPPTILRLFEELIQPEQLQPTVYIVDGISQPFVWGIFRGAIYLPGDFMSTDNPRHRREVLAHELAHVKRFDALVNLLQILSQAIYFFHPLVWIANRIIRNEREKSCDEAAIATLNASPREYGSAIVTTLVHEYQTSLPTPSLAVAGPIKNIEDRIKTIMKPGRRFYKSPTLLAVLIVLLIATFAIPTTIALTRRQAYSEKDSDQVEKPDQSLLQADAPWRERFDQVYRLEENQILKRIAPPFIPEREIYYRVEEKDQYELIHEPPSRFVFHWDREGRKSWGLCFSASDPDLRSALTHVMHMKNYEFEGTEAILKAPVTGDWILRNEAPIENRLNELASILHNQLDMDIIFEKRQVRRQSIVVTGNYHFQPTKSERRIIMFSDQYEPDSGGGGGHADSVNELIQAIGDRVGIPVIDNTQPSGEVSIGYDHQHSAYLSQVKNPDEKARKLKLLLQNISDQTNLHFSIESRLVDVWFVEEPGQTYDPAIALVTPFSIEPTPIESTEQNIGEEFIGTWFFENPMGDEEQMAIFPDGRVVVLYSNGHQDTDTLGPDRTIQLNEYGHRFKIETSQNPDVLYVRWNGPGGMGGMAKMFRRIDPEPKMELLKSLTGEQSSGQKSIKAVSIETKVMVIPEKAIQSVEDLNLPLKNGLISTELAERLNQLYTHAKTRVLTAPRVITKNRETAELQIGDTLEYIAGYNTQNQPDIKTIFHGIQIKLLPEVTDNDNIILDIEAVFSRILSLNEFHDSQGQTRYAPTMEKTEVVSQVILPNEGTILLGGITVPSNFNPLSGPDETDKPDDSNAKLLLLVKSTLVESMEPSPSASTVSVKPDRSPTHIYQVQPGDTLADIAEKYYGSREKWKTIIDANRDKLSSPDQLRPGMRLLIPDQASGDISSSSDLPSAVLDAISQAASVHRRDTSMKTLKSVALGCILYAENQDGRFPASLQELVDNFYVKSDIERLSSIRYLAPGRKISEIRQPQLFLLAYDKDLLMEWGETTVAFADGHVEFCKEDLLKELNVTREIEKARQYREHAETLKRITLDFLAWGQENNNKFPDTLIVLHDKNIPIPQKNQWIRQHIVYLAKGKIWDKDTIAETPIAYDKTLLRYNEGTYVAFADGRVLFCNMERLKQLGIVSAKPESGNSTIPNSVLPSYSFAIYRVLGHEHAFPFSGSEKGPQRRILFSEKGNKGADRFDAMRPENYPLEGLIIDDKPLFTDTDILEYDWEKQTIYLKQKARSFLPEKPSVWGIPFVVVVQGKRLYLGAFWTGASSYTANMPTISLDPWQYDLKKEDPDYLPANAIRINPSMMEGSSDLRKNPYLRDVLQSIGKLVNSDSFDPPAVGTTEKDIPKADITEKNIAVSTSNDTRKTRYPFATEKPSGSKQIYQKPTGESIFLRGSVMDPRGSPIPGTEITIGEDRGPGWPLRVFQTTTDLQGQFQFQEPLLPAEREGHFQYLIVKKNGYGFQAKQWNWIRKISSDDAEQSLILSPGITIRGQVVDESGRPLPNTTVRVSGWRNWKEQQMLSFFFPESIYSLAPSTNTDAKGAFILPDMPDNSGISLIVTAPDHVQSSGDHVRIGEFNNRVISQDGMGYTEFRIHHQNPENVQIGMLRAVTIEGKVVLKQNSKPMTGIPVLVQSIENRNILGRTITDDEGRFRVSGIKPTECYVQMDPDKQDKTQTPNWIARAIHLHDLKPGQTQKNIVLTLEEGQIIQGKVMDTDGIGLGGVDILVFSEASPRYSTWLISQPDGSWQYRVPTGRLLVTAHPEKLNPDWYSEQQYELTFAHSKSIDNMNFEVLSSSH